MEQPLSRASEHSSNIGHSMVIRLPKTIYLSQILCRLALPIRMRQCRTLTKYSRILSKGSYSWNFLQTVRNQQISSLEESLMLDESLLLCQVMRNSFFEVLRCSIADNPRLKLVFGKFSMTNRAMLTCITAGAVEPVEKAVLTLSRGRISSLPFFNHINLSTELIN
jgi:hypothetical protein